MNKKRALIAFNLTGIGLCIKSFFLDIVKIQDDSFEPLIPKGSYMLITKKLINHSSKFLYYYSPKNASYKVGYQICDQFEWMNKKDDRFLIKISENNIGFDTYNDHSSNVMNKSFIVGKGILVLSPFKYLDPSAIEPEIDHKKFEIQAWNNGRN